MNVVIKGCILFVFVYSSQEVVRLQQLLTPGMLIRCVVSSLDSVKEGHTRLKVSINPKGVNKMLSSGSLKPGMVSLQTFIYYI